MSLTGNSEELLSRSFGQPYNRKFKRDILGRSKRAYIRTLIKSHICVLNICRTTISRTTGRSQRVAVVRNTCRITTDQDARRNHKTGSSRGLITECSFEVRCVLINVRIQDLPIRYFFLFLDLTSYLSYPDELENW